MKIGTIGIALTVAVTVSACTSGRLEYITPEGEREFACATEYTWQPRVDKYAVEYVLAHCARQAVSQGHAIVATDLLELDLSVPHPPEGERWSRALAKQQHQHGLLTDREYGYLIAYLDLGHNGE